MLDREEDRFHVDVHHPVELGLADLVQQLHLHDPGVVDHDVQAAELPDRLLDRGPDLVFLRHVSADERGPPAVAGNLVGDGPALVRLHIDHRDGRAFLREQSRDRLAHPGRRTADPGYLVFESSGHWRIFDSPRRHGVTEKRIATDQRQMKYRWESRPTWWRLGFPNLSSSDFICL